MLSRRLTVLLLLGAALGAAAGFYSLHASHAAALAYQQQLQVAPIEPAAPPAAETVIPPTEQKMPAGNFVKALQKLGLSSTEAASASIAAQHAFNLRQVRAGNTITLERTPAGALREIDYKIDSDRLLQLVPHDGGNFSAEVKPISSTLEVSALSGRIDDSLFNAMQQSGGSAELTMRLAQIFGYDLDFYTDPRKGDTFRVVVEKKKYADGQSVLLEKFLPPNTTTAAKNIRTCCFMIPAANPLTTPPMANPSRKNFSARP